MAEDQNPDLQAEVTRLTQENALLSRELVSLRHVIRSLQDLADASDRRTGPEHTMELLQQVLHGSLAAIGAEDGSLLILDEDTGELVFVLSAGKIPREQLFGLRVPPGRGIVGWVAERREPTIVEDVSSDERFYSAIDQAFDFHTRMVLAAPIVGGGRVMGVVELLNKEGGQTFSADDLALVTLLCRFAGELLHATEEHIAAQGAGEEAAPAP